MTIFVNSIKLRKKDIFLPYPHEKPGKSWLSHACIQPIRSIGVDIRHHLLSKPPKPRTPGTQTQTNYARYLQKIEVYRNNKTLLQILVKDMSEYKDFPKDFIDRSKANVKNYEGKYEVTNLINNCLGLIIIPKERLPEYFPKYEFDFIDKSYGITRSNITRSDHGYSLWQVIRHIRNGLSHGRIEQKVNGDIISGLRIYDKCRDSCPENFSIQFNIEEFRSFAFSLSTKLMERLGRVF